MGWSGGSNAPADVTAPGQAIDEGRRVDPAYVPSSHKHITVITTAPMMFRAKPSRAI